MSQTTNVSNIRKITEAAIMLALATVLSIVKLLDLPYGGSVTVASMFPVIVIAYRHGVRFGLLTGCVFGIIQQLLGLNTLTFVTTWQSILAVILLDYVVAFMVLGLGGVFRDRLSQPKALAVGTLLVCILRYLCHVISGATVWAGLSIPSQAALIYSIGYNATYMIPETIVTVVIAYYIGLLLDFGSDNIQQFQKSKEASAPVLKWIGGLIVAAALVFDVRTVFANLQNADTGEFDVTGFANVNWTVIAIVTAVAIVFAIVLFAMNSKNKGSELQ